MIATVDTLIAALGVLGQLAVVLILLALAASAAVPRLGRRIVDSPARLQRQALWAAWVVAAVATAGSLYFSEVAGYIPCQLCWYQRIAMYPLSVVLLVAAATNHRYVVWSALAFPPVGALIAARHIYIEINPAAESAACQVGAPCSTKWIEEFGYVTIPVLSATAFVLIGLLLVSWVLAGRGRRPTTDSHGGPAPG